MGFRQRRSSSTVATRDRPPPTCRVDRFQTTSVFLDRCDLPSVVSLAAPPAAVSDNVGLPRPLRHRDTFPRLYEVPFQTTSVFLDRCDKARSPSTRRVERFQTT